MVHSRRLAVGVVVYGLSAGACLLAQMSIASALLTQQRNSSVAAGAISADSDGVQPAASLEAALQQAFQSAGVVFTGVVISVDRTPGAVVVRWLVEDAVAGVASGAVYEQREWPGLWADGRARYQVGERALVLLHAPSVGGYASPVSDGVIPLRGDAVTGSLDLRWMAQHVAITDVARLRPMLALRAAGGDLALSDVLLAQTAAAASVPHTQSSLAVASGSGTVIVPAAIAVPVEDANAQIDGAMILGMLHAWKRGQTAGR